MLHNRREDQSEQRMENCPGIRAFSLALISSFRLITNHNFTLIPTKLLHNRRENQPNENDSERINEKPSDIIISV